MDIFGGNPGEREEQDYSHASSEIHVPKLLIGQIFHNGEEIEINIHCLTTDLPVYSDNGYNDTPVTVTVLTGPKWSFLYQNDVVRVTLAYSDTFLLSQGCLCKRVGPYSSHFCVLQGR